MVWKGFPAFPAHLRMQLFLQLRLLFPESGCTKGKVNDQRPGEGYQLLPTQPQVSAPLRPTSLLALALVAWEGLARG